MDCLGLGLLGLELQGQFLLGFKICLEGDVGAISFRAQVVHFCLLHLKELEGSVTAVRLVLDGCQT